MANVEVYNKTKADVDTEDVRRFAEHALDSTRDFRRCEITVTFVGDKRIQDLNEKWRGKGRPTDVLSFPMYEPGETPPAAGDFMLGDIVICPGQAAEDAREENIPFGEKVRELVLHSLLHLMGYDHETQEDARKMNRRRRDLLRRMGGV